MHRAEVLDPRDVRKHRGIPVSSPGRTLLEISTALATRDLERALDEALVQRLTTIEAVRAVLARYPGRPGCAQLQALTTESRATTMTRSEAEERLLALVRRAGLPPPEVNVRIGRHEVDFLWRRERVIVEVDGYRFHGARLAFERHRARDAELQAADFTVIRVTWRQLEDEPEAVLVRLATALARRAA